MSGTEENSAFCVGILLTIPFENNSEETQDIVSFSSGMCSSTVPLNELRLWLVRGLFLDENKWLIPALWILLDEEKKNDGSNKKFGKNFPNRFMMRQSVPSRSYEKYSHVNKKKVKKTTLWLSVDGMAEVAWT